MESGRERERQQDGNFGQMKLRDACDYSLVKHTLPTALPHHVLFVTCARMCVWLGVHSSQTQLAMSFNQGRKLTPATEFCRLTVSLSLSISLSLTFQPLRHVSDRHSKMYFSICLAGLGGYRVQTATQFWDLLAAVAADWKSQCLPFI